MINDIKRRLVEVEVVLNQLDEQNKQKIPREIWRYIQNNKDKKYIFEWNKNTETYLHLDTVTILTYINKEYLLNKREKRIMEEILILDGKNI